MALSPNRHLGDDPEVDRFRRYLMAERNVAEHTLNGYLADLAQFASSKWGAEAEPPFNWKELDENDARRFVLAFTKDGAKATTVLRKMAAARTFCRFLQREEIILDNPFSLLKGPRKAKTLPKVLSVGEIERFLALNPELSHVTNIEDTNALANDLVFRNAYGQPITQSGFNASLHWYAEKYGIPKEVMHAHSFRHFYAIEFLKRRNDIALLADLLGHKSINITQIYLRQSQEQQRDAVDTGVDWF